ncbi:hypothetical protein [Methylocella sp.]
MGSNLLRIGALVIFFGHFVGLLARRAMIVSTKRTLQPIMA